MTMQTKTIGRMPTDHGPYVPGQAYGKKFQVQLYGCVWESKHDNNNTAPATLNTQAGTITPNTTDWKKVTGSTDQWLIDNGYKPVSANNVKDGNQSQHDINSAFATEIDSIETEIGNDSTPVSVKGRIKNLETEVGNGGSVDERIAEEGARHYLKSETYTKQEVNGLVSTPHQGYVTVADFASLPVSGSEDTIYRVSNYDGTQVAAGVYSEYAWNGTQYVFLCAKSSVAEVFDISEYHSGQAYATLEDALDPNSGGGVPQSLQNGGMSIKFVRTSDNKYVQYRLMKNQWSANTNDWEEYSVNALRGVEIPLSFTNGSFYDWDYTNHVVILTASSSSYYCNLTLNKGVYVVTAKNNSDRSVLLVSSSGKLIKSYKGGSLLTPASLVVPEDNCTLYISSVIDYTPRLWNVSALLNLQESILGNGIENLGVIEMQKVVDYGKYYYDNGGVVAVTSHSSYMCTALTNLNYGMYFVNTILSGNTYIFVTDSSGNIVDTLGVNADNCYSVIVPQGGGLYVNFLGTTTIVNKLQIFSLLFLNDTMLKSLESQKSILVVKKNWTLNGYFASFTRTVTSGTGYYIKDLDIEGYDEVEITYGEVSNTSSRYTSIFDKDGNFIKGIVDRYNSSALFKLDKRAKYLCASTLYNTSYITLRKYNVDGKIEKLEKNVFLTPNPLENIDKDPTLIRTLKKISCIGDSLTEGAFNTSGGGSVVIKDYAYPAILKKLTGVDTINLGISSSAANRAYNGHSWYDQAVANEMLTSDNIGDCIIIELGTNDISYNGFDGNVSTDIDVNDRNNNALTAVGGYANIIQAVLEISPKVKIFCVSVTNDRNLPEERAVANQKIKEIAEMFDCYYLDLATYAENTPVSREMFRVFYKNDSHNNAMGHCVRARQFATYIDWLMLNHLEDFRNIQFVGTDYNF